MTRIVPLKFQQAGRQYKFNAQSLELKAGDKVIVETDRGRAMAIVVIPPREIPDNEAPEGLKNILRTATEEDLALAETNTSREKDAYRHCVERIKSRKLEMKLVRAEYAFDGSKIIFYFTADGRIDFRELVKDLAHYFHTRIEMRQIGVRDEAKLVGGLGICGRELCCSSFLTQFNPVSVKMAKEQGLALNPTKISGQCGRLLCCLGYEFETYTQLKKGMPKQGKKVMWQDRECEVTHQNILRQQVTLRDREGNSTVVTMEELRTGQPNQPAETEKSGESHTTRLNKGKPQGQRSQGQKPQDQKAQGQRSQGQRPQGQKSQSQRTQGQKPKGQGGQEQSTRKQPNRGQKPANRPASPEAQKAEQVRKPDEKQDKQNLSANETAGSKPSSRRRRRGRRRPRSGGKPDPSKQGE
ncbi:regulatory iron-sulfur-containing complex subunit RicT [Deltaproteobacteria bacterium IMCC39524]|nr:regulatory iron-sulfur-containing complex subunit RicT [Deltaproteobacteria bacterium IMCC39524]